MDDLKKILLMLTAILLSGCSILLSAAGSTILPLCVIFCTERRCCPLFLQVDQKLLRTWSVLSVTFHSNKLNINPLAYPADIISILLVENVPVFTRSMYRTAVQEHFPFKVPNCSHKNPSLR